LIASQIAAATGERKKGQSCNQTVMSDPPSPEKPEKSDD